MRHFTLLFSLSLFWLLSSATFASGTARQFDVVVYGGTSGGVIAAVAAAREGAAVALLEPGRHLGGMTSGGLSRTDHGRKETIGGYSREFYERVGKYYNKRIVWYFEPHVAERVFNDMAAEARVKVFFKHRLKEKDGVRKQGSRIVAIRMEDGSVFRARVFVDSTYEGDLMAQAGVSFTVGREGVSQYGEEAAGVYPTEEKRFTPEERSKFELHVSAYDDHGKLLPEIQAGPRGKLGSADKKVQAYCFRMCLTDDPGNQIRYPKPPNYDPQRYALLARLLEALAKKNGAAPAMKQVFMVSRLENRSKADINNNGRFMFSTDYIGKNWDYPTASYKRRAEIWNDHINYTKGLFYFLAHDPQVPKPLREEINRWGLAKDEFADNDHWPYQLYIREARRMVGDFVITQKDIQTELTKPEPIGMGSYASDSHNVQRYVKADGTVSVEGNTFVPVSPYQISYQVMLPKKKQVTNLLVPVCVSASHVAFSTLRMEPVYMILGQAAGVAAMMAIDAGVDVQDIDTRALTAKLRAQGVVFEWKKPKQPNRKK